MQDLKMLKMKMSILKKQIQNTLKIIQRKEGKKERGKREKILNSKKAYNIEKIKNNLNLENTSPIKNN